MVRSIIFMLLFSVFYVSSILRESYNYRNYGNPNDVFSSILKVFAYVFSAFMTGSFFGWIMESF